MFFQSGVNFSSPPPPDLLVRMKLLALDVGCPATAFRLSGRLLAAHGRDRVWILSASNLGRLETWHHPDGDLADIAVEDMVAAEEGFSVVMVSASGRLTRRRLSSAVTDNGDKVSDVEANGLASPSSSAVLAATICKERTGLSVSVGEGGRIVVETEEEGEGKAMSGRGGRRKVLAELVDDYACAASVVKWERLGEIAILGEDNVIRVYSFLEEEGEQGEARLSFRFGHDGHRAGVTDFVAHPAAPRLNFSADERGCLHAWAFCAGAGAGVGADAKKTDSV